MQGFVLCRSAWATRPHALTNPHDSSGTSGATAQRKQPACDAAFLMWNDSISLWLSAAFFHPHTKNWKSTANMFNVSHANIKMGKRACILSFILHKPFAWTRTEKNRHENWVEWFWNISKWREKERSFSTPGQAGSFGLIKTNRMRAGGLEALGKAVSGDGDFNPAVARHTDISNPSAFRKQST